jgi:hypothetical protein
VIRGWYLAVRVRIRCRRPSARCRIGRCSRPGEHLCSGGPTARDQGCRNSNGEWGNERVAGVREFKHQRCRAQGYALDAGEHGAGSDECQRSGLRTGPWQLPNLTGGAPEESAGGE